MAASTLESPPNPERVEEERYPPTIRLEIFRHDAKDTPTTAGPRPNDRSVRLTPEGRRGSSAAGISKQPRPEVAIAVGSSRERSVESALRQMLAEQERMTPDMTLEEIRRMVADQLRLGRKDMTVELLDFNWDGTKQFHDQGYYRTLETHDALRWVYDDSDRVALQNHDEVSTSYSRAAGNIAEVVRKYLGVLPRWKEVTTESPGKYERFNNELQRFLGSHQSVIECFLMKVIEKTEGRKAVEQFIESLPDKNGMGLSEGYTVIIRESGEQPEVVIRYGDKEWSVRPETISEIISEKDDFNRKVLESKQPSDE